MKKRSVVNVMGQRTPIKHSGKNPEEAGHYDRGKKCIVISVDEKGEDYVHTLLHELGHVLLGRVGLSQALNEDIEEVIVDSYATMITETFKIEWK